MSGSTQLAYAIRELDGHRRSLGLVWQSSGSAWNDVKHREMETERITPLLTEIAAYARQLDESTHLATAAIANL